MHYSWWMNLKRCIMYSHFTQWFTLVYYVGFLNHICYYQAFQIKTCMFSTCHVDHYSDVIKGAMASQITSLTIVYWNCLLRRRSKKTSTLRVTGLWVGISPVTGEFPDKRPVTRKLFPFDDVIMEYDTLQLRAIRWLWWTSSYLNWVTATRYVPLHPDTMPGS